MGSEIQECLNCLCHARSGCWDRRNCASYSITKDYWKAAGSPSIGFYSNSDKAFKACMKHENCILNTVKTYTGSFGELVSFKTMVNSYVRISENLLFYSYLVH